jgi:hypothetical protein
MEMPRPAAAAKSIEAFRDPVDAINFKFGRRRSNDPGIGVRSRMMQTTSNGASRSATAFWSPRWSLKTATLARSLTFDQSTILIATPW